MAAARGGKKVVIVKKKTVSQGGHHGGSWKVAYADFVTAMMAFFMVMWIIGMDDKTKAAIEGYFSNPIGYRKGYGSGTSPLAVGSSHTNVQRTPLRTVLRSSEQRSFEQLRQAILQRIAENDSLRRLNALVDVKLTTQGLRIELVEQGAGEVYFALGSARMKPASMLVLQIIGSELSTIKHHVVIEGHTDAARFGSDGNYGNWELSADRANAARRVLEGSGVDKQRVKEVRGYADTQLRVPEDPMSAANRRISILLPYSEVPDVAVTEEELAAAKRDSLVERLKQGR